MKEIKESNIQIQEGGSLTKPKVSVIIPTYNRAKFLQATISTVLAQTYSNFEIIVVDDGSTDDTKHILESFRNCIRYLEGEHKGTAHARNVGMKAATGKYIAFLDSDDQYYPYKLQIQVEFLEKHPEIGMVYTEFSGVGLDGSFDEYHIRDYHPNYKEKGWSYEDIFDEKGNHECSAVENIVTYYTGDVFRYTLMGTFVSSNTMVFPKIILETVGYQNEAYRYGQDYEFTVRVCKHCRVAFLNIPTYKLFYHDNQATRFLAFENSKSSEKMLSWISVLELFIRVVIDWGYHDEDFYFNNREFMDNRLLNLYCDVGKKWLEYGDVRKAKKNFKESKKFGVMQSKYRRFYRLSYCPKIISTIYLTLGYQYKKLRK